jgi:hypothetical protein
MDHWSPDDAIAMERRHIVEGGKRVARQEALVRELVEKGSGHIVPGANELLHLLRESLGLSRARLRDLEGLYPKAIKSN